MTGRDALACLALVACDWSLHRMSEQPKCKTDRDTPLLASGACNLRPPDGTVEWQRSEPTARPPRTRALLVRGRDRYERFCAPCHGVAGDGDSDVARAMTLRRPPSLIDEAARTLPDARLFETITHGYGVMPGYDEPLATDDRWAVIAFVHVLQSRDVAFDALTPAQQQEALQWLR
jgi:mono/diheme cytochrome c family protein